ncbi:MAG: HAMP domain-containing histidine kinase [Gammaproteobacteria bacterium]|nr:HAMP domain-containing histidine kinase [Gammaproteobacteria bacterium]
MRLKTSIFLWIFPAVVVPLVALVLIVTTYSESQYTANVNREVHNSLDSIIGNIDRRLLIERNLVKGLVLAPAIQRYIPVLDKHRQDQLHPQYVLRTEWINSFLETFQSIMRDLGAVRILDTDGGAVIKVASRQRSKSPSAEITELPYVEVKPAPEPFLQSLKSLTAKQVGNILHLIQDKSGIKSSVPPVMSAIVPLERRKEHVGYFVVAPPLSALDRILNRSPRLNNASLLLAERNPGDDARDGLVLYDDTEGLRLNGEHGFTGYLRELFPQLQAGTFDQEPGFVDDAEGQTRIYFREYHPYPGKLISWVLVSRIDLNELYAPFERIRLGVIVSMIIALMISLTLAKFGAGQIATPVSKLAMGLTAYANGTTRKLNVGGTKELRKAGEAFNYMTRKLHRIEQERDQAQKAMVQSAKLVSVGQMAAGIGHEINNPLGNILSLTKLMERELPEDEMHLREDVQKVREEADRVSRIVRGILNFARQVPLDKTRIEVKPWLEEAVALVQVEATKRNVAIRLVANDGLMLDGDRDMLQQTMINLLNNAIHASPSGSEIRVLAMAGDSVLHLVVEDSGSGISPKQMGSIYDPFFTTKPVGQGSGLGLSICLGIVERHNGTLELINRKNGGVRATISLLS